MAETFRGPYALEEDQPRWAARSDGLRPESPTETRVRHIERAEVSSQRGLQSRLWQEAGVERVQYRTLSLGVAIVMYGVKRHG